MKTRTAVARGLALAALPVLAASAVAQHVGVLDAGHEVSAPNYVSNADPDAARKAEYERLWWGQEFARLWRDASRSDCDARVEEDVAYDVLAVLDDLPPAVIQAIHDTGVSLILHEGHVTQLPECADLRGDPEYDDTVGLFRHGTNTAFVQTDRRIWRACHTLLHEFAHALDCHAGAIADQSEFQRVYAADDAIADLGYPETVKEHKRTGEYFAEAFADWFMRREWTKRHRPAAARYMAEYEARLTRRHYSWTELRTNRAARRRAQEQRNRDRPRNSRELDSRVAGD